MADMISYAALFVLAKLLVSQFISGAYEDHLILAVYCAGAVLSVIPYAAFVRFDVKKPLPMLQIKRYVLSSERS